VPKIQSSPSYIITLFAGGLAGSIFTWYMNRPTPTVISYNISTTTVGAGPEVKSLVPGLKIQIGNREIPIFYVDAIDFSVQGGPGQDSAEIAILFPGGTQILGTSAQAPTPLHKMSCSLFPNGVDTHCTFGPLNPGKLDKFWFQVATDQIGPIRVITAQNKLQLVALDEFVKGREKIYNILQLTAAIAIPILSLLFLYLVTFYFSKRGDEKSAADTITPS
jgi:hypothetical protein